MQQMLKCAIIQQTFAACNSFLIITDQQGITREKKRIMLERAQQATNCGTLFKSHEEDTAAEPRMFSFIPIFSYFFLLSSWKPAFRWHLAFFFQQLQHCVRMIMIFNSHSSTIAIVGQLQFLIKLFCNGTHKVAANNVKICINEQ